MFKSLIGGGSHSFFGGAVLVLLLGILILSYFYAKALKENSRLEMEITILEGNTKALEQSLQKQNEALKALSVEASKPPKEIQLIKKINPKDSSCEAELRGYKQLFKEMGR